MILNKSANDGMLSNINDKVDRDRKDVELTNDDDEDTLSVDTTPDRSKDVDGILNEVWIWNNFQT